MELTQAELESVMKDVSATIGRLPGNLHSVRLRFALLAGVSVGRSLRPGQQFARNPGRLLQTMQRRAKTVWPNCQQHWSLAAGHGGSLLFDCSAYFAVWACSWVLSQLFLLSCVSWRRCVSIYFCTLQLMGVAGVLVNCALIGQSGLVQRMWPDLSFGGQILLVVVLEHLVLAAKTMLDLAIPDVPEWIRIEIAKVEHWRREAFNVSPVLSCFSLCNAADINSVLGDFKVVGFNFSLRFFDFDQSTKIWYFWLQFSAGLQYCSLLLYRSFWNLCCYEMIISAWIEALDGRQAERGEWDGHARESCHGGGDECRRSQETKHHTTMSAHFPVCQAIHWRKPLITFILWTCTVDVLLFVLQGFEWL